MFCDTFSMRLTAICFHWWI